MGNTINGRMKFKILWVGWRNACAPRESDTMLWEQKWNCGAYIVSVLQYRGWMYLQQSAMSSATTVRAVAMLVLATFSIVVVMMVPHGGCCPRNDLTGSTLNQGVRGSFTWWAVSNWEKLRQGTLTWPGDAENQG